MSDIITFFMHNFVLIPHCIFHFNAQYAPEFECSLQRNESSPINITVQCRLPGTVFNNVAPSLCTELPRPVLKGLCSSISLEPWQSWMCAGVDRVCLPALLHAAVLAGLPQRCLLKLTVGPDTCIPKDGLLRISSPTGIKFVTPPSKQW